MIVPLPIDRNGFLKSVAHLVPAAGTTTAMGFAKSSPAWDFYPRLDRAPGSPLRAVALSDCGDEDPVG